MPPLKHSIENASSFKLKSEEKFENFSLWNRQREKIEGLSIVLQSKAVRELRWKINKWKTQFYRKMNLFNLWFSLILFAFPSRKVDLMMIYFPAVFADRGGERRSRKRMEKALKKFMNLNKAQIKIHIVKFTRKIMECKFQSQYSASTHKKLFKYFHGFSLIHFEWFFNVYFHWMEQFVFHFGSILDVGVVELIQFEFVSFLIILKRGFSIIFKDFRWQLHEGYMKKYQCYFHLGSSRSSKRTFIPVLMSCQSIFLHHKFTIIITTIITTYLYIK